MFAFVILVAAELVVLSVVIHVVVLRRLSRAAVRWRKFPVTAMGVAMVGAILGHLLEICLFGVTLYWLSGHDEYGRLLGDVNQGFIDYLYYSAVTYTSLGFGDVTPEGDLRLLSAVEVLTGLVLIAWTASFAFLLMQELWEDDRYANRK